MQPHTRPATVIKPLAHGLHIWLDALVYFRVAADHEGQSATLGAWFRAGARHVQILDALFRQGNADLAALAGGDRACVRDHGPGLGAFYQAILAENDFFSHLRVADAQEDAVSRGAHLLGRLAEDSLFGFGQFLSFGVCIRPERYFMSGAK